MIKGYFNLLLFMDENNVKLQKITQNYFFNMQERIYNYFFPLLTRFKL